MNYTINAVKLAEVLDEMPTSPNQQSGLGFGVYLDNQNPNDGESLSAIEKSFPVTPKQKNLNKYMNKPNSHMIAFEDLISKGEPLEKIINLLKEQNADGLKNEMADQMKKIPRVNN